MPLPSEPPAAAARFPRDLPLPRTPLIGRDAEFATARALLLREDVGLLTFTGAAGAGKTRLALAVAAGLQGEFTDGVVLVELAPVTDPTLVLGTIADALGIAYTSTELTPSRLIDVLRARHLLLLLDNLEHLLPAAVLVGDLLRHCPRLTILATSREPLHLTGEHLLSVPPLALPPHLPDVPPDPEVLRTFAAVELFCQRAAAVRAGFELSRENAADVAEICCRLDGLPLAIELAAARSRLYAPRPLLAQMAGRLGLLTDGPRDLPARQQTQRKAIAWSYDLLGPSEQQLFCRLAVFVGGCTPEAAAAVCNGYDGVVQDGLLSLTDKSLLTATDVPDGTLRFSMLETVREFAAEHLAARGDLIQSQRRHLAYLCDLADRFEAGSQGSEKLAWLERIDSELPNLRAALSFARDTGSYGDGVRLFGTLTIFWRVRGHLQEGRRWGETFLAADTTDPAARGKALYALASIAFHVQRFSDAQALFTESAAMFAAAGDEAYQGHMLTFLVAADLQLGDSTAARAHAEAGLALCRKAGHTWHLAWATYFYGTFLALTGEPEAGRVALTESIDLFGRTGDPVTAAYALAQLGDLEMQSGNSVGAAARITASADLFRLQREHLWQSRCHQRLALLAAVRGAAGEATDHLRFARHLREQVGMSPAIDSEAAVAGAFLLSVGRAADAARFLGAVATFRAGEPVAADDLRAQGVGGPFITQVRAALSPQAFAAAWAEGGALDLDAVIAMIASVPVSAAGALPVPNGVTNRPAALSAREIEVLRLLTAGHTNPEIAELLILSPGTVARHTANIYAKIGARGRADAVAFAVRHGLTQP